MGLTVPTCILDRGGGLEGVVSVYERPAGSRIWQPVGTWRNMVVNQFYVDLFNMLAQEMNDHAVEEFAKYFIGRPNHWVDLTKKSVLNPRTSTIPPRPAAKVEPKYVIHQEPAPQSEEKKTGLLGSLIR